VTVKKQKAGKPHKDFPNITSQKFAPAKPQAVVGLESKSIRMIDRREVMHRIPVTYPTIWRWMQDGNFPRALNVGGKMAWLESAVEEWIMARPQQRIKGDKVEV